MRNLIVTATLTVAFAAALVSAPLAAQTASLVKDINTESDTAGSLFERLTAAGGNLFFTTDGPLAGKELWVSDGTAAGTRALLDPCPGACGSGITFLGSLQNVLLFSQSEAIPFGGAQLWRSDGTTAGTFRLAPGVALGDLVPFDNGFAFVGCAASTAAPDCGIWRTDGRTEGTAQLKDLGPVQIGKLAVAGGRLFFPVKASSASGGELSLWSSDGTAAGTSRVKTLGQGTPGTLAAVGQRLLFFVLASDQKPELWTSDGTSAGTFSLKRFSYLSLFVPFTTAGGRAYFVAVDGAEGPEVWTSDGTAAGTRRVTGFSDTSISTPWPFGGRVVFVASDGTHGNRVWSTAGTLASTTALPGSCGGCDFVDSSTPFAATAKGLVFPADDGVHGREPWITDGTAQGTHLLADLCPGPCDSFGPYNRTPTPAPQGVLFAALDPAGNEDLWRTDGTAAGTVRLSALGHGGHILPDVEGASVHVEAASLGATLFFGASNAAGPALWATAGKGAAAHRVAVVSPQGPSSLPSFLTPYGDRLLFFTSNDGTSSAAEAMWITRGTAESTVPAGVSLDRNDHLSAAESVQSGGLAFFRLATSREGHPLLRTDGTAAGLVILAPEVEPGIAVFQGRVFFAKANTAIPEIWSTDGTKAGTRKEFALPNGTPEAAYLSAPGAAPGGTDLYFITGDFDGSKVWRSDGTLAGTQPLADLPPIFVTDYAPAFTRLGSRVLFVDPENSVWTTDGTPAGTLRLTSGGAPLGQAYDLALFNGAVYFFGATPDTGVRGLFRTDGTSAGTVFLKSVYGLTAFNLPDSLLVAGGGRLWFTAYDSDHGTELWSSDGTAAGTAMVKDIVPGPDGSSPAWLTFAGDRLFFSAADGVHGIELWQSDGTADGTRMVQDIAPLADSSAPDHLTVAGDRLYFSADDGPTGRELWSLPLTGPGGCQPSQPSQPSETALCLGGRYRVEAHWRDFAGHAGEGHAVPLTPDTGTFWFFDPTNVEAIVKVLDGHGVNGHEWVFYGALSNVEYLLTVTDTQTGLVREYYNPSGQFASAGDTHAFGPQGANGTNPRPGATRAAPSPLPLIAETAERGDKASAVPCQPGAQRLCLNNGRFGVEVAWKDFQGHAGQGTAVPLSGDTGTFWFFDATNVELVVKALDGRPVNGHFWLFYGALSNVEYTVTVTDSQTGTKRTYTNPSGRFASVADTLAF